jgi:hypothetical protein
MRSGSDANDGRDELTVAVIWRDAKRALPERKSGVKRSGKGQEGAT